MRWPWGKKAEPEAEDDPYSSDAVNAAWKRRRVKWKEELAAAEAKLHRAECWARAWWLLDTPERNDLWGYLRNKRINRRRSRAASREMIARMDANIARLRG